MGDKGGTIWGSITDSLRKLLQAPVKKIIHIEETCTQCMHKQNECTWWDAVHSKVCELFFEENTIIKELRAKTYF